MRVYDSYAHHPNEIAGDLAGRPRGRRRGPAGRRLPAAPGLAHPDLRRRRWARRSAPPTRSSCSTSTSPARTPTPRSTGALVADAVPLPAERVAFVPDLADAPAALAGARPARRPGADPRRRRRHRRSAPRCCELLAERADALSGTATRDADRRPPPVDAAAAGSRKRFAAPAVGAALAGLAVRRSRSCWRWSLRGRRRSGWCSSRRCSPSSGSRSQGTERADGRRGRARPPPYPTGEPLAPRRPRRDRRPGSRRWPRCASADVTRQWPDTGPDRGRASGRRSRSSRSAAQLRGLDDDGRASSASYAERPTACRGCRPPPTPAARRCARRAAVVGALPRGPRRRGSTTSRSRPSTRSRWCCATAATVRVGERGRVGRQGRGARGAAEQPAPRRTTSACPASRPPSD